MDDPLTLLREYMMGNRLAEIQTADSQVVFSSDQAFPQDTKTPYKSQRGASDFYPLGTLLFFCKSFAEDPQKRPAAYVKEARDAGQAAVHLLDRTDLLNYLSGKTETSAHIQTMAPDFLLPSLPAVREGAAVTGDDAIDRPNKRSRTETSGWYADDLSGEARFLKAIFAQERQLRDRNSQLMVPGKSFKKVLDILSRVQQTQAAQAAAASKQASAQNHHSHRSHDHVDKRPKPSMTVLPSHRFDRPRTEHDPGTEFGIKAYGTGKDTAGPSEAGAASGTADKAEANGATPPEPSGNAPAPSSQPPQSQPAPHSADKSQHRSSSQSHSKQHSSSRSRPSAVPSASPSKKAPAKGIPIILVPSGATAKINIWNVKCFLEKGEFRTAEECKADGVVVKDGKVDILRRQGRQKPVMYHAMEVCPAKTDSTWRRVVAVFVQGKKWQFKQWPFKGAEEGDLVDTFARILGVHLHFHDEQVDPLVKTWNVKLCSLHRHQRHRDALLVGDFWKWLDVHLKGRNSQLEY